MMDDLIRRQDAAKIICNWCGVCPEDKRDIMNCDDICPEFARIPSAQQWIPCEKKLPEKFGDYLVSVKRHWWNCEEHIENDIAYWDDLEGFHKAEEVLAWMPLPEPYRGENDG